MQVSINIPKEFEDQFNEDKFADTFARILMDIEPSYKLAGNYEKETIEMLYKAFQKAIKI